MSRRDTSSGTQAFSPPKPKPKKKNFVKQLTSFFKPLSNLFGASNVLSAETKPVRDLIDIRAGNRNRGYRKNQFGKMTYFENLDEEKKKKKKAIKDKPFDDKVKEIKRIFTKPKREQMTNPKSNVKNKLGQKLTLIRPPLRKP